MSRPKKVLVFIMSTYFIALGLVYVFQEKIIFQPSKLSKNYRFQFDFPFEEVFLDTPDDERLHAIHFKNKTPKGVIVYFHGNKGNLDRWGKIVTFFSKKGYDVLVMDYRSYGKSTGKITQEYLLYEDAQLFYDYVVKQYSENEIIVYGRSLGTGIATKIASKNSPTNLILETPFYSLEDVTKHWLPIFPVRYMLKYTFESYKSIKDVNCAITIYHGTEDRVVSYTSGKKLFDSIPSSQKRMITVVGGAHNNLIDFNTYLETIDEVLENKKRAKK